jgi:hypothetical protein
VRLIGDHARRPDGHALCLLRPEHFSIEEAADGPAAVDGWDVIDRRFSGSEILFELSAADGQRLWVEAGSRVRHLELGDRVMLRLREIETVAFGRRGAGAEAGGDQASGPEPEVPAPRSEARR